MAGFERRHGVLLCDDVSLEDAVERFGTPLYLYSRALLEDAYRRYDRAFASVPHRVCYALKANASNALLQVLSGLGAGADIVSGMELRAALRAGFDPQSLVFSGVGKTPEELVLAVSLGIGAFNVESEDEIEALASCALSLKRTARIRLRVNPDIDPRSHPYISTGLRENKFGVPIGEAPGILGRVRDRPGLVLSGLQCHIGSQISDLGPLAEAARDLARLSRRLLKKGFALDSIDLGGGLAIDYEGGTPPDPEALARRVLPALRGLGLRVFVEPGRSLVGPAGVLLTRVLYRKENGGRRFLVVDAAMNDLLRPALYGARHRIEPVRSRGGASEAVDVVGPICETADFLSRDCLLETAGVGEILAVRDAGAYAFSMASNYNLRPRGAEVLVEEGSLRLIRRRETFEDLMATEIEDASGPRRARGKARSGRG